MQVEILDFIAPNVSKFDDFTKGYLAAILWTESEVEKRHRLPSKSGLLDSGDCSSDMLIAVYEQCKEFQEKHATLLEEAYSMYGYEAKQAGVDFWLTRNRHGAGYWDRSYLESLKDDLTDAAHGYGEQYVSVYKRRLHIN